MNIFRGVLYDYVHQVSGGNLFVTEPPVIGRISLPRVREVYCGRISNTRDTLARSLIDLSTDISLPCYFGGER